MPNPPTNRSRTAPRWLPGLLLTVTIVAGLASVVLLVRLIDERRHGAGAEWLNMVDLSQRLSTLPVMQERYAREAAQVISGGRAEAEMQFRQTARALNVHHDRIDALERSLPKGFVELARKKAMLSVTADDLSRHVERMGGHLDELRAMAGHSASTSEGLTDIVTRIESARADLQRRLDRRKDTDTAALKSDIRTLDHELRSAYFNAVDRTHRLGYLLAGSAAAFMIALAGWVALLRRPAVPGQASRESFESTSAPRRFALASGGTFILVLAGLFVFAGRDPIELAMPGTTAAQMTEGPAAAPPPGVWPRFRGSGGRGVLPEATAPLTWNGPEDKNILWRSEVPYKGTNSPIVWGDRIFMTGAWRDPESPVPGPPLKEVYCFDTASGELIWQSPVMPPDSPDTAPQVMEETGFAAPTATTDGKRVYALFADGDLAALDAATGREVWAKNIGVPENAYGHASSLTMAGDLLIVQYDQSAEDPQRPSALIAFEGPTGREAWRTPRDVPASWASPVVIPGADGEPIVVTSTTPWLFANDARTGEVVWKARVLGGEIGPSPTWAESAVYACNTGEELAAVRTGGAGDVTESHVAWRVRPDSLPDVCTPVANEELLFLIDTMSVLRCFDTDGGKQLWTHQLEGFYRASPVIAGDRLYVFDEDGLATVFAVAREPKVLAANRLFEVDPDVDITERELVKATPAFSNGRIYIRTGKALYCIGASPDDKPNDTTTDDTSDNPTDDDDDTNDDN